MSLYRWVHYQGTQYFDVGLAPDGSLHNPRGYPPEIVRAALQEALQHAKERRAKGVQKRRERRERRVYITAQRLLNNLQTGPRQHCYCCGKALSDPAAIARGIGSECWQQVLAQLAQLNRS
jgi:hypothetical protein